MTTAIELPSPLTEAGRTEALTAPEGAETVTVALDVTELSPPGAEFSVACYRSAVDTDPRGTDDEGWDINLVGVYMINTAGRHLLQTALRHDEKTADRYQLRWNVKPGITVRATAAAEA